MPFHSLAAALFQMLAVCFLNGVYFASGVFTHTYTLDKTLANVCAHTHTQSRCVFALSNALSTELRKYARHGDVTAPRRLSWRHRFILNSQKDEVKQSEEKTTDDARKCLRMWPHRAPREEDQQYTVQKKNDFHQLFIFFKKAVNTGLKIYFPDCAPLNLGGKIKPGPFKMRGSLQ